MFCKNCGNQIGEGKAFCEYCGAQINVQTNNASINTNSMGQNQGNTYSANNVNTTKSDNNKVYKILAYIGVLWLVGLLSSSAKQDAKVRFHVGQGIITTICIGILYVIVAVINNLVIANIFTSTIWGVSYTNSTGLAIMGFLNTAVFAIAAMYEIMGIVHAVKDEEKELPIIGSHAFYR